MINFKYPEERQISVFYAKKLNADMVLAVLEKGNVANKEEAIALSKFYWDMVDETVRERDSGVDHDFGDMDMWLESICNRFFFYLSNNGYEEEWEEQL
jgi:hypothetical protein